MRKALEIGGIIAALTLIAFGVAALVIGIDGRSTVNSSIKQEQITGTPDMTPALIAAEVTAVKKAQSELAAKYGAANVPFTPTTIEAPTCSVAGKLVDSGDRARCFAQYMRIHALASTDGLVYSQMGRFMAKPGTPVKFTDMRGATSDPKWALVDAKTGRPVDNGARNLWVTETALSTALNSGYMASQISMFGVVVGLALLLSGLGFGILAVGGALRNPEYAFGKKKAQKTVGNVVPTT
jgi:hypothetical protein